MLPLSLLRTAQNHPMLVELKNGETYNGHLVSCDNWMNISLREVICTSRDGDKFWRMPECYIRGSNIKYLRIPDEVIDLVKEEVNSKQRQRDPKRLPQQRTRGAQRTGPQMGSGPQMQRSANANNDRVSSGGPPAIGRGRAQSRGRPK